MKSWKPLAPAHCVWQCRSDTKKGCFLSGQIAAMVKKEQPAAEILSEVMEEAEQALGEAAGWIG